MKRLKIILNLMWVLVISISVLFLSAIAFFVYDNSGVSAFLFKCIALLAIVLFGLYIRVSYIRDNFSKEEQEEIAKKKESENYGNALFYVVSEECGSKNRFIRRYGKNMYEYFVDKGIILAVSEKKWHVTDKARRIFTFEEQIL